MDWCAADTSENQFYPVSNGGVVICVTAKPYPTDVTLFSDVCECCDKNKCTVPMDTCAKTTAVSTAATKGVKAAKAGKQK